MLADDPLVTQYFGHYLPTQEGRLSTRKLFDVSISFQMLKLWEEELDLMAQILSANPELETQAQDMQDTGEMLSQRLP